MTWPLSIFSVDDPESLPLSSDPDPPTQTSKLKAASVLQSPLLDLLRHYDTPGVSLPPSARVGDPKLKQRDNPALKLWHFWKYGAFAAVKVTELVGSIASFYIRGPPRKTWGIEMTLLNSIMRDAGRHSHLADITTVRLLMSIGGLVPLPSDALVTPVTIPIRKRELRGILADFDAAEDGTRELSGEWVVGKRTWQRLQQEWRAAKKAKASAQSPSDGGQRAQPVPHPTRHKERVVLYLHGGAYYMFSPATHRLITIPLSKALDARLFAVDYRLAPETRFPGPLHDAVSAYFRMIDDLHIPPQNIILVGDSAGGGLALALMMYLRDNDYPLPSGAILMSPWVDLTMSCDSWESNYRYDIVPMPEPGDHLNPIACYLGEHMEEYLTHPYASPLFGDLKGLPPLLIQAGDAEVLRDEITLFAHKATLAGVKVRHELYEDGVHVFQSIPFLDAAGRAFMSSREFVRDILHPSSTSQAFEAEAEEELEQEIDNDATRVVQGDGTESKSGRDTMGVSADDLDVKQNIVDGAETPPTSDEEPSWVSSVAAHQSEQDVRKTWLPKASASLSKQPSNASLRRHSTTTPRVPAPTTATLNQRLSSYQYLPSATSYTKEPSASPPIPRPLSSRSYRTSTLNMCSSTEPAPQPSIRRLHSSHPDISSLCQEWANRGPANQTLTYKLSSESLRPGSPLSNVGNVVGKRKHSRTVSSVKGSGSGGRYII